jgi:hypothetical protein
MLSCGPIAAGECAMNITAVTSAPPNIDGAEIKGVKQTIHGVIDQSLLPFSSQKECGSCCALAVLPVPESGTKLLRCCLGGGLD